MGLKVFAPRYVLDALELLFVDLTLVVVLALGVGHVVGRIERLFALPAPSASTSAASGVAAGG